MSRNVKRDIEDLDALVNYGIKVISTGIKTKEATYNITSFISV